MNVSGVVEIEDPRDAMGLYQVSPTLLSKPSIRFGGAIVSHDDIIAPPLRIGDIIATPVRKDGFIHDGSRLPHHLFRPPQHPCLTPNLVDSLNPEYQIIGAGGNALLELSDTTIHEP